MEWNIRPLVAEDTDSVLSLWADRLGDGFPHDEVLDAALSPDSPTVCFVAVTPSDDLLGFAIGQLLSPNDAQKILLTENPPDWATDSLGYLHTNCVAKSAEGHGIGTALLNRRLSALREQGAERFFAVSWIRETSSDSSSIFERVGFECVDKEEAFWYEDSLEREYDCADCGNPCTCPARVYVKDA